MLTALLLAQVLTRIPATGEQVVVTPTTCSTGQYVKAIATDATGTCETPAAGAGDLLAANNLSELTATAATARTNLGLGTLATQSGTFSGTSSGTNTGDQTTITGNAGTATALAANPANCAAGSYARGIDATGAAENCTVASGGGPTYVLLTADRTNATTSYADITDLIIPVSANTRYDIECKLVYSANATTTGLGIGWTGPASPTLSSGRMTSGLTSATIGGTTSIGNDTGGVTTASVATSGNSAIFEGFWSNGANAGNVQIRFKSEVAVASAIVIKSGSWCKYNSF